MLDKDTIIEELHSRIDPNDTDSHVYSIAMQMIDEERAQPSPNLAKITFLDEYQREWYKTKDKELAERKQDILFNRQFTADGYSNDDVEEDYYITPQDTSASEETTKSINDIKYHLSKIDNDTDNNKPYFSKDNIEKIDILRREGIDTYSPIPYFDHEFEFDSQEAIIIRKALWNAELSEDSDIFQNIRNYISEEWKCPHQNKQLIINLQKYHDQKLEEWATLDEDIEDAITRLEDEILNS